MYTGDSNVIFGLAAGLLLLYLVMRIFVLPIRYLLLLIYNAIIGGVLIWLFNLLAGANAIHLALNPITMLMVGFLRIPGLALLVALTYMFG